MADFFFTVFFFEIVSHLPLVNYTFQVKSRLKLSHSCTPPARVSLSRAKAEYEELFGKFNLLFRPHERKNILVFDKNTWSKTLVSLPTTQNARG